MYDFEFVTTTKKNLLSSRFSTIVRPVYKFFHNVLHPPYRITHDVYSLMFLCDFINFFILVFGFYAFGVSFCFCLFLLFTIGFLIEFPYRVAILVVKMLPDFLKRIKFQLVFSLHC